MSSKQVDRYLDREGLLEENVPMAIRTDDVLKTKEENQKIKDEILFMKMKNDDLSQQLEVLKVQLQENKAEKSLLSIVIEKQKQMAETLHNLAAQKFDSILPANSLRQWLDSICIEN